MSDWPGLATVQMRELAREYAIAIASAGSLEAMPGDAWLDVRLRALGCPDDQLAAWRERIKSTPLRDVADQTARRQ
jgi:hypothetical protein